MQTATQENRTESEASILKRHERMIRYIAIPFAGRGGASLDDLTQEGAIALLDAARKWDGTLGVTLATYAWKFVFGAMVKYTSREVAEPAVSGLRDGVNRRRAVADVADQGVQDDAFLSIELEADAPSPEETLETSECVAIAARELSFLDEKQRRVLRMRFADELDVRTIAEKLGTSKSEVDRIYHGAIDKLRERVGAQL
jgi:RNA polymerase sigma factor (sigma-70 family)